MSTGARIAPEGVIDELALLLGPLGDIAAGITRALVASDADPVAVPRERLERWAEQLEAIKRGINGSGGAIDRLMHLTAGITRPGGAP